MALSLSDGWRLFSGMPGLALLNGLGNFSPEGLVVRTADRNNRQHSCRVRCTDRPPDPKDDQDIGVRLDARPAKL